MVYAQCNENEQSVEADNSRGFLLIAASFLGAFIDLSV